MKRAMILTCLGVSFLASPILIHALPTSISVPVSVEIEDIQVTVSNDESLSFGVLIPGSANAGSGTATINASGLSRASATGITTAAVTPPLTQSGGTPQSGRIKLKANNDVSVDVTLPDTLTLSGVLNVTAIEANSNVNDGETLNLVKDTDFYIHIGGSLTVPGGTTAGTYTNDLQVSFDFN